MKASTTRRLGLVLVALSIVGLAVSIPAMARRLAGRNTAVVWFDEPVTTPKFKFAGQPVSVETVEATDARPARIQISWRGKTVEFPIEPGTDQDPRLPGLLRHEDWMSVLLFAQGASSEEELQRKLADGEITPRLVVGMRLPAPGVDPDTWGKARKRD